MCNRDRLQAPCHLRNNKLCERDEEYVCMKRSLRSKGNQRPSSNHVGKRIGRIGTFGKYPRYSPLFDLDLNLGKNPSFRTLGRIPRVPCSSNGLVYTAYPRGIIVSVPSGTRSPNQCSVSCSERIFSETGFCSQTARSQRSSSPQGCV